MKSRSRLKHSAAGLLGSLISRNNDVNGYWAPGLLYRDVSAAPHAIEIDLLSGASRPASSSAQRMAAGYAKFLREALKKNEFEWDELTRATIAFKFNAQVPDPNFNYPCGGDPFICTVLLHSVQGHVATVSARARCYPYRRFAFMQRWLP